MIQLSDIDKASIESAAWHRFDCKPSSSGRGKEDRKRRARREQVSSATDQFVKAMNSESPPTSRDEAIRMTLGLLARFVVYLFPGAAALMLAAEVAGWIWDNIHGKSA